MSFRRQFTIAALVAGLLIAAPASAHADFGFKPGSVTMTSLNRDGTIDARAGSHPYSFTVHFDLNTDGSGHTEGGELRDVIIDVPPGLVGNPLATPSCPRQSFEGGIPNCMPSTQIGMLRAVVPGFGEAFGPLYNLVPPPGVAAQLGFSSPVGLTALQSVTVRGEEGPEGEPQYGISASAANLPIEVSSVTATIWGAPADPGHTPERGGESAGGIPSDAPLLPFLTLPTSCGAPPQLTIKVDSKLNPGAFVKETASLLDRGDSPMALAGCEAVPFSPAILAAPHTSAADSATGLDFKMKLPNKGLLDPKDGAIAETEPMKTEITFPAGITPNPSAANGLAGCTKAQFKAATLTDTGCPEASKIGTLQVKTPLLEEAVEGSIYLAQPRDNPFNSFLAIYIVARVPERGVLVKQAGEVQADPLTGQLTTTVEGLPPIPYSSIEVNLREGPKAPLITPVLCGHYTTTAKLYPFSDPTAATQRSAPFTITTGAGGTPCASSEAALPAHPSLEAGASAPLAGAFSPFVFRVSRSDGEQRFSSLQATLPKGLTGRLAGVPACTEAQIAAAQAREVEGGGALEAASPSCPQASQVGTVTVAAGAGPQPYYVQGRVYLAGPFKSAPLSLVVITPAVAGPFDLGAVVARAGLYVDEETAQVTVKSDPLPTILQGIPLDVRKISVSADRQDFILNPTSCEEMAVSGQVTMSTGAVASLQNRFQVGGCRNLSFKPKLKIALKGPVRRGTNPRLIATFTPREGDANTSFAQVTLPRAAFLDNAHIRTICTRVQFAAEQCPAGSIYGRAEATTPLLDYPLSGTVYLRSNPAHVLPDLLVAFRGPPPQPIKFALAGKTDSVKGALRNTIETAPDVPVSSFRLELFGGSRGLVELSSGLCAHPNATVRFKAHSGREYEARPRVGAKCGGKGRKSRRQVHGGGR